MVVELKKADAMHKARSEDYGLWKAAEDGCKKLIRAAVEEVHINKLKDGTTFFHKVKARDLLEHLEKNSTGLHALNIVTLRTNMLLFYKNAASMPDFILTMEEAQKKAKRTELPILDIELAMYAATSVLQSGDYKKETDKWEGRNASKKTWTEWKQAYLAAYAWGINRSVPELQMNRSLERPTTSCRRHLLMSWMPLWALSTIWRLRLQVTRPPSNSKWRQTLRLPQLCLHSQSPTKSSPERSLDSTYHQTYEVVMQVVVGETDPKASGAITVGCTVTKPGTPVRLAASRLPGHDVSTAVADTKGGKDYNKDWYLQGNKDT